MAGAALPGIEFDTRTRALEVLATGSCSLDYDMACKADVKAATSGTTVVAKVELAKKAAGTFPWGRYEKALHFPLTLSMTFRSSLAFGPQTTLEAVQKGLLCFCTVVEDPYHTFHTHGQDPPTASPPVPLDNLGAAACN